jgi:hypothetical protein
LWLSVENQYRRFVNRLRSSHSQNCAFMNLSDPFKLSREFLFLHSVHYFEHNMLSLNAALPDVNQSFLDLIVIVH